MNDQKSNDVEQRAVAHAFGLLAAAGDAKAAKVRLDELIRATVEHDAKLVAATTALAEADEKSRLWKEADAALATRIREFQDWVDRTEASYRQREDRVRTNEVSQEQRDCSLVEREADLDRRVSAFEGRVSNLRQAL
jgi:hypothetical protein